jgi:hypothetical protein
MRIPLASSSIVPRRFWEGLCITVL